jgi:hypothetical protein
MALIDNSYKIYSRDEGTTFKLYDLMNDPQEKTDIAPQQPEIVKKIKETITAWRQSCRESLPGRDKSNRSV